MSKDIRKLFQATSNVAVPPGLENQVLIRIDGERRRIAKRNLFIFGLADIISVSGLVASFLYLVNIMAGSSFYNYLSLLWLDSELIVSYWHELALSLVESLPVIGLTTFLIVALALLLSLSKTINNFKLFRYDLS